MHDFANLKNRLVASLQHDPTARSKPPAPEVFVPTLTAWPVSPRRPAPPAMLALFDGNRRPGNAHESFSGKLFSQVPIQPSTQRFKS
jgi:hypothetical protein